MWHLEIEQLLRAVPGRPMGCVIAAWARAFPQAKASSTGRSSRPASLLQESVVAGARNTRFLRLIEREIPKLVA